MTSSRALSTCCFSVLLLVLSACSSSDGSSSSSDAGPDEVTSVDGTDNDTGVDLGGDQGGDSSPDTSPDATEDGMPDSQADATEDTTPDSTPDSADSVDTTPDEVVLEDCDVEYADHTVGLKLCSPGAFDGYTLFAPLSATTVYLLDMLGQVVHSWETEYTPGNSVYLLEDGTLLVTGDYSPERNPRLANGGKGGIVQTYDWDGNRLWSYEYSTEDYRQHHDIEMLPNGNVLMIAWEYKTTEEAEEAGRDTSGLRTGFWPDIVIEVEPSGAEGGTIVWEWRVWDHLVQDNDRDAPSYGDPADNPQLIDVNYQQGTGSDWLHINGIDYNADLDQIVLSVHNTGEMWIIDHSTTTTEAARHAGGDSGMGGDILYRWGNPHAYGAGEPNEQELFGQHDTYWIEEGLPGAGNILVFDNGMNRTPRHSRILEVETPVARDGSYPLDDRAFGPDEATWIYQADPRGEFYSANISGAQRQPNGNTLICEGASGHLFEVTESGEVVWSYVSPVTGQGVLEQGETPAAGGAGNSVFRAYRYDANYPGLTGRDLTPGDVIEQ